MDHKKGVVCSGYTFLFPFLYNNKKFASPVQYIVVTLSINKHLTLGRHFNYNGKKFRERIKECVIYYRQQ